MPDIDPDLAANYEAIVAERGIKWEDLADSVESDPNLAAWMRSKAADAGESSADDKPKGRAAKAPADTAGVEVTPVADLPAAAGIEATSPADLPGPPAETTAP